MKITKPLSMTDQQVAQLDLHSLLNVLNILMGELQLLQIDLSDPGALTRTVRASNEVLHRVQAGELDAGTSQLAATLREIFKQEWSDVRLRIPSPPTPTSESAANLESILQILTVRLAEYQERLRTGTEWRPHSIRELSDKFINVFAAIEKNSKGRYRILYNIAAQDPADYLVNLRIESVDGDVIAMPPVLQDLMRDLIANARKYTAPGGEITAGLVDNGTELRMVVEDTGCGIPMDEIEKVVNFGYRASNVRDKATRGGGFGLTKAYYNVTRLGGTMWIDSELGKGTRITIHLPRPAIA